MALSKKTDGVDADMREETYLFFGRGTSTALGDLELPKGLESVGLGLVELLQCWKAVTC